ncbi:MAG: sugar nucleotide-binding protein [Minisyncoccia bacterium]
MIILLGGSGYVGEAFKKELRARKIRFFAPTRKALDYTNYSKLLKLLKKRKPDFVINAAGYTGKPNIDACELNWADTLLGNVVLPTTIAEVCQTENIPWAHISSGCIYNGTKISRNGKTVIEKNLNKPEIRSIIENSPEKIRGFNEKDTPNFSFRNGPCSFYSGTKALAEEILLKNSGKVYILRLRVPFDEFDNNRNYLSKIQRYSKVYNNTNTLSHLGDFVKASLDLWKIGAPYGIYNIANPGFITTKKVVEMVEKTLRPKKKLIFWKNDKEFYSKIAKTPRSNCILDVSKLLKTGVKIRTVEEALIESLSNWHKE